MTHAAPNHLPCSGVASTSIYPSFSELVLDAEAEEWIKEITTHCKADQSGISKRVN